MTPPVASSAEPPKRRRTTAKRVTTRPSPSAPAPDPALARDSLESTPERPGDDIAAPEDDFYHWSAILRSVSAFEIYRKVYRNVIRPEKVAELLVLRADMPRSLAASLNEVVANLDAVANEQSHETRRRAGRLQADLRFGRIDEILAGGLHGFLTRFLERVSAVGAGISRDFLAAA